MKSTLFLCLLILGSAAHAETRFTTEAEAQEAMVASSDGVAPKYSTDALGEHSNEAIHEEALHAPSAAPMAEAAQPTSAIGNWWDSAKSNVAKTWASDQYELYMPLRVWHNRRSYTREKIDSFNEQPWGIGLGRYRFDEKGNWHAIFAMTFQDSHNDVEPIIGYAWQATYYPAKHLRTGIGFVTGITARSDMSYVPIPAPLPLVSLEYRKLSLQATYIPGGKGNGNVAFTWLRYQLN